MNYNLDFRLAVKDDLPDIIEMLSDDPLGATREQADELSGAYEDAFAKISSDQNQELTVVELDGSMVATFQLTFIQYLTHAGGIRAQVEAVRTAAAYRGQGIGKQMFHYIINRARQKGCVMVQLTTDKKRSGAIRFYEDIGFISTHEGMKLKL